MATSESDSCYVRLRIDDDQDAAPVSQRIRAFLTSRHLKRLARIVFNMSGRLWVRPIALLVSAVAYEVAGNRVMFMTAGFYESVTARNTSMFLDVLWKSVIIVITVAFIKALKTFSMESCALQFRRLLVESLHSRYFQDKLAYRLLIGGRAETASGIIKVDEPGQVTSPSSPSSSVEGERGDIHAAPSAAVDNPDQRITNDVDLFSTTLATILASVITVPGLIVYYSWYLWRLFGWTAPVSCYAYFFIGLAFNSLWFRRLIHLVYQQERLEGSFRYQHARYRANIEAISLYGGVAAEGRRTEEDFRKVLDNRRRIIRRHFPLYCSTYFFDYLGFVVNYSAVGAAILWLMYANKATSSQIAGLVAEGSFSCLYIINAFSTVLDTYEAMSDLAGYAGRLCELIIALEDEERIEAACNSCSGGGGSSSTKQHTGRRCRDLQLPSDVLLKVDGMSLRLGTGRCLIDKMSFQVKRGEHVLIRGPSGVGKSSLFKALAGLWMHSQSGEVRWGTEGVLFVPQDAYCFPGSLLEQVAYPEGSDGRDPEDAIRALRDVGLGDLLEEDGGLQQVDDWPRRLSKGEAQRIALARLLYQEPELAVLDEATSGLDAVMERKVMGAIVSRRKTTLLSAGHRQSLEAFHLQVINLCPPSSTLAEDDR